VKEGKEKKKSCSRLDPSPGCREGRDKNFEAGPSWREKGGLTLIRDSRNVKTTGAETLAHTSIGEKTGGKGP